MNFNLFTWMREGVKQSILLGVSDAIETIGLPEDSDQMNPKFLEFMRQESGQAKGKAGTTRRKRLGRSLKDMEAEPTS
jgi:hypothetical protein